MNHPVSIGYVEGYRESSLERITDCWKQQYGDLPFEVKESAIPNTKNHFYIELVNAKSSR